MAQLASDSADVLHLQFCREWVVPGASGKSVKSKTAHVDVTYINSDSSGSESMLSNGSNSSGDDRSGQVLHLILSSSKGVCT